MFSSKRPSRQKMGIETPSKETAPGGMIRQLVLAYRYGRADEDTYQHADHHGDERKLKSSREIIRYRFRDWAVPISALDRPQIAMDYPIEPVEILDPDRFVQMILFVDPRDLLLVHPFGDVAPGSPGDPGQNEYEYRHTEEHCVRTTITIYE